jgi:hypothetical protein
MTRKEAERRTRQDDTLRALGFTQAEADALRRISNTLQRWYELECGTGDGQVSRSVERENEDGTGKPFMRVQYPTANGYHDSRHPIPDRETGAKKRLAKILADRNKRHYVQGTDYYGLTRDDLSAFIQTDPRGAALYILRPGNVPEGADVSAYYSRGICVY